MQHRSKRRVLSIITAFTAALCFSVQAVPTAETGSFSITADAAEEQASIYDEYLSWSQLDTRWSQTSMGGSNIRSSGCLLTSLAIMAVHSDSIDDAAMKNLGISDIEEFNPGVLANAYSKVNGFTSGGAIASWGTIHQLVPQIEWGADKYFKSTNKEKAADELNSLMDEGWHIIARVNNGYFHWVYIRGVDENGDIIMSDPAKEEESLYKAYPNGLQGEYWMIKGNKAPGECGTEYKAGLEIDLTQPAKTEYYLGEELDFGGSSVIVSGVDPKTGEWQNEAEEISLDSAGYSVDLGDFDPETTGTYTITVNAEKEYASASASFEVTVRELEIMDGAEYFLKYQENLPVYESAETKKIISELNKGNVVVISEHIDNFGLISSESFTGWVDVKMLECVESTSRNIGDINNDGKVDKYDLALLNIYIQQDELLPDGVSTLSAEELEAADVNCDGAVNIDDVIEYLAIIYG